MMHLLNRSRRALAFVFMGLGLVGLSACANLPDHPSTCGDREMRGGSWPYCTPAEPANSIPGDQPIDPRGRGGY